MLSERRSAKIEYTTLSKNTRVVIVIRKHFLHTPSAHCVAGKEERWGAGVETQKNVRKEIGGWGRVPFNEPYAPSLSTIYDGA